MQEEALVSSRGAVEQRWGVGESRTSSQRSQPAPAQALRLGVRVVPAPPPLPLDPFTFATLRCLLVVSERGSPTIPSSRSRGSLSAARPTPALRSPSEVSSPSTPNPRQGSSLDGTPVRLLPHQEPVSSSTPRSRPQLTRAHPRVFFQSALSVGIVNLKPLVNGRTSFSSRPQASPHARADVLVIPRRVIPRFGELTPAELIDLFASVQQISKVVEVEYTAEFVPSSLACSPCAS